MRYLCFNAVPWLKRLVAGLLPRRPGLHSGLLRVRFVVWRRKWHWDVVFSDHFSFPCQYRSTSDQCSSSSLYYFFPVARQPLGGLGLLSFRGFTITLFRHTTCGRTPLDEGPARRRDLYLTTHNTDNRQTYMPPVGFFFPVRGFSPLIHSFTV
jgi:hypothetical protein